MTHEEFMLTAFEEAFAGMRSNKGGPFGAIIVSDGCIIGQGCNQVTSTNDPTAHAEIVAIRNACRNKNSFQLSGSVLYTSCEPCPMCLAAIYWSNIKMVYFCSSKEDADTIGFIDKYIYDELNLQANSRRVPHIKLYLPVATALFDEWTSKIDKTTY